MSANIDDGGPAFPGDYYSPEVFNQLRAEHGVLPAKRMASGTSTGMTLRDYFAGQALAAIIMASQGVNNVTRNDCAGEAYAVADAMLAARQSKPQGAAGKE